MKTFCYRAPLVYVALFYSALVAWTVIATVFLGTKGWASWVQFFMVAFVFAMTWYFSLGISYRIKIEEDGRIELTSLKKTIRIESSKIGMVEGPHLPVGFMRFRLEREKAYLFCIVRNRELQEILSVIRKTNPDIILKSL